MKWSFKLLLVIALLVLVGGAVYFYFLSNRSLERRVAINRIDMKEAVFGIGTLTARNTYELKFGVATTIEKVFKREGDIVKKGEALVVAQGVLALTAPFSGIITSVIVNAGENIGPNVVILTLTDLSDIYLTVRLEQSGIAKVRPGQIAEISFESLRGQSFAGTVQSVYPSGGDFIVQVSMNNQVAGLLPGMTADVGIEVGKRSQVLAIPAWALTPNNELTVVSKDNRKSQVKYKVGLTSLEMVEIEAPGIKDGDAFITSVEPKETK